MMKSLFAGATALALVAGAAVAQQSYDSSTTRTTTVTAPVQVAPPETTTTTVQRTVAQPQVIVPPQASSYREEHLTTKNGQPVDHSVRTNTKTPYANRTTTYSQTTTKSDGDQ